MNYYNEHDKRAAAWLRELIAQGSIPQGYVDERDIQSVTANDLTGFRQCHFFAGIGGWPLALRIAGVPDDYPVWSGSAPCQPFSIAGRRMGTSDERHLWPYFRNLIGQCRPGLVFGEQVASPDGLEWLAGVRAQMVQARYVFGASDLPAACVGAPHKRQRLFWVAHTKSEGRTGIQSEHESRFGERPRVGSGDQLVNTMADANGQQTHSADAGGLYTKSGGDCSDRDALVHPDSRGRQTWQPSAAPTGLREAVESASGDADAVGDTNMPGRGELLRAITTQSKQFTAECRSVYGGWSDWRAIHCGDEKWRRIPPQSSIQLLADGLSDPGVDVGWLQSDGTVWPRAKKFAGRVGLLKGFGNAINPYVAAQFIRAALESLNVPL